LNLRRQPKNISVEEAQPRLFLRFTIVSEHFQAGRTLVAATLDAKRSRYSNAAD